MHPPSTAFKWHKKLNPPPRQEVESFIRQHSHSQDPNVAVFISLAETEGFPETALCVSDSMIANGISFLCRELFPISPTVSKG